MSIHSTFTISQTDGRPMYLQIIEQIRHKVAVGDWQAGAEIPSIRQLAADLSVSVITVKRAYLELEREGVILTQQGRGSIVSHNPTLSTAMWEQQLERALDEAASLGHMLGLAPDTIKDRLDAAINQRKDD
jgi:GntR family transcriptional regulator